MRFYLPRAGEITGVTIPAASVDGHRDALGVIVDRADRRSMAARIRQVAKANQSYIIGQIDGDSKTVIGLSMPQDPESVFEALGVSPRKIRVSENAIDLSNKDLIAKLWDREAQRLGLPGAATNPRLIGVNIAGKDVFQRAFGRTFIDGNNVHGEWEPHRDGGLKRENGRGPMFLLASDEKDWSMLARTAVATTARFGRISQQEIDDLKRYGDPRDEAKISGEAFRELIEAEMARSIVNGYVTSEQDFDRLSTGLPPFVERSGSKLSLAQFSTPPAIGWIAARFIKPAGKSILEPTIGNGLLVASSAAAGARITGFEIDERRATRAAGVVGSRGLIASGDFTKQYIDFDYDAVVVNPPFGSLDSATSVALTGFGKGTAAFKARSLDSKIAIESLNKLKSGGDAVLVMPAELYEPSLIDGHRKAQQVLFNRMFNNVRSVALDSKLYRSMGANAPVLVHFLSGRKDDLSNLEDAVTAAPEAVDVVQSFSEFFEWAESNLVLLEELALVNEAAGDDLEQEAGQGASQTPEGDDGTPEATQGYSDAPPGGHSAPERPRSPSEAAPASEDVSDASPARTKAEDVDEASLTLPEWYDDSLVEDEFTKPYVPFSAAGDASVVIQRTLQGPVYRALKKVQEDVEDLDAFVAERLGVEKERLLSGEILSPEQIDSIALGLYRRARGEALIVGDKMGVGKGRQLAALALAALRDEQPVMFSTLDPTLFTDFASRDLRDVSGRDIRDMVDSNFLRPFIFNPGPEAGLRDPETGEVVFNNTASERNIVKKGQHVDSDTNLLMITYSQLQTQSGHWRLQSVLNWLETNKGKNPLLLLDEVHKAAGVESRTGVWMQAIINKAREVGGDVVYSSATSMKSGKNIVVYSAALPETGISTKQLTDLMEQNPLSMQEVLSAEMASGGRLIEREMSAAGIERVMVQLADLSDAKMDYARRATDVASDFLAELVDIAPQMKDTAKAIAKAKYGGLILNGQDKTVDVTTTSPVSQFDNYSRYLMLAVKGMFAEELILHSIGKGEKPTLVVDSTADTLTDWVRSQGSGLDGQVDGHPNIGHVLKRNASRLLEARIETAMGDCEVVRLEEYEPWYEDFCERVNEFDWSQMRINVLDHIAEVCERNGLTFKDITRRSLSVTEQDGKFFAERREPVPKSEAIKEFASGKTDVLGLNKGAATGLSAHASPVLGPDVRRRSMIPLQFQKDITDQRQVEGRINRFAQISAPIYYTPSTGFAADERLANLFNRANRNLTSSTSASRENATNIEGIDLLNPVGDMAVAAFAKQNPEIAERMDLNPTSTDLGRKLLGRIVCLRLEQQEAVLSEVDTIFSLFMERLSREGRNPLRLSRFDWDGEVETINVLVDGVDGAEEMSRQPVYLNRVTFTEHVRWETSKDALERVEARLERAGVNADPAAVFDFGAIRSEEGGFNYSHLVFADARHGGSSVGEGFRNLSPVILGEIHRVYSEASLPSRAEEGRSKREVASELFFDSMKYHTDHLSEGLIAAEWKMIRTAEKTSGRAFNPSRYMLQVDRAAERAEFFNRHGHLLRPGSLVGIRMHALPDYMQGEFGKAIRNVGLDDGIIPAVITSVRSPDDGMGTFSDWSVSFLTAGSQGFFSQSLSSLRTGLSISDTFQEGQSPVMPIEGFMAWVNGSPRAAEVLAKVYGDRWNGVAREMQEQLFECQRDDTPMQLENTGAFRLFSIINDNVPSGSRRRERFVLEGNLFAALALVQSGKKANGEKAIYTDVNGENRHAIVLSETETDGLLLDLSKRSEHTGLPTKALSKPSRMQAYFELMGAVFQLGDTGYLRDDEREHLHKQLSDAIYEIDQGLWHSLSTDLDADPEGVARSIADMMGNSAEDVPLSIAVGGDPWRWCYDAGSRVTRGRRGEWKGHVYPATTEVRDSSSYEDGRYRIEYHVDLGLTKFAVDSIDQSSIVALAPSTGYMSVVFRKSNPILKDQSDDPVIRRLIEDSSDHLANMKLGRGLLCKNFDLGSQHDVVELTDILSLFAKLHQNEVVVSGGGKRIYKGLEKLSEQRTTKEQAAVLDAKEVDISQSKSSQTGAGMSI